MPAVEVVIAPARHSGERFHLLVRHHEAEEGRHLHTAGAGVKMVRALLDALEIENLPVERVGGKTLHFWNLVNCGDGPS